MFGSGMLEDSDVKHKVGDGIHLQDVFVDHGPDGEPDAITLEYSTDDGSRRVSYEFTGTVHRGRYIITEGVGTPPDFRAVRDGIETSKAVTRDIINYLQSEGMIKLSKPVEFMPA